MYAVSNFVQLDLVPFFFFFYKHKYNPLVNNLHMCCRSPGPQGGARSTDTGPAHEPAAGSLPAAESTQHRVDKHQQLLSEVILSLRV